MYNSWKGLFASGTRVSRCLFCSVVDRADAAVVVMVVVMVLMLLLLLLLLLLVVFGVDVVGIPS